VHPSYADGGRVALRVVVVRVVVVRLVVVERLGHMRRAEVGARD
jgi:hypothetical protein